MKPLEDKIEIKENEMEHLLMLYCQGMLSGEELKKVEAWLKESSEHRKLANQIEMLFLATDTLQMENMLDTEKALKKVKRKMFAYKKSMIWMWMQRAAAILFLPVLTALIIEYFTYEDNVRMMEVRTNPGMIATIVLPDNSVVHLNSMSTLRYPSSFSGADQRLVELDGEAFFEVEKDKKKRFIVSASNQVKVEALGTSFNVEAYKEESNVAVTLVEGRIGFDYWSGNNENRVLLTPNQKILYDANNGKVQLLKTSCETETSWKDNKIILNDTPLKDVLRILEKRYGVKFLIRKGLQLNGSFTGTFTNQRLERILEYFQVSVGLRWKYVNQGDHSRVETQIEIY